MKKILEYSIVHYGDRVARGSLRGKQDIVTAGGLKIFGPRVWSSKCRHARSLGKLEAIISTCIHKRTISNVIYLPHIATILASTELCLSAVYFIAHVQTGLTVVIGSSADLVWAWV